LHLQIFQSKFTLKPSTKNLLKNYIAGAMLSNSPIWIFIALIPHRWFNEVTFFILLILYLISMSGGALSGYLIARKTKERYSKTGIILGIFAYCLYAISMTILGITGGVLELPPFIGFVIGGAIGARYYEVKGKR